MAESGGLDVILGWMYGGGRFVGVWLLGSVLVLSGVSRMVSLFPMFNAMVS